MKIEVYNGNQHTDTRGSVLFFNEFDLGEVVRIYEILPNPEQPRGWQGHQSEKKWFYCKSGSILVNLIKIDNFDNPSVNLLPSRHRLSANNPQILAVPGGYATAFKALEANSNLMVFSNFTLQESQKDDYRFPIEKWTAQW